MSHSCNFSYLHYKNTLKEIKKNQNFSSYHYSSNNGVILRHDVDYSLESAVRMAKIEKDLGVKSTYFILFHSEFYNTFSPSSIKKIKQLVKADHHIGLHYDASAMLEIDHDPSDIIKEELEIMEKHFQTEIKVISAHDPSIQKKIPLKLPSNIIDAYSEKFIIKRKYLSESVQCWREGCFCKHIYDSIKLQILIHPIWWTKDGIGMKSIMKNLEKTKSAKISNLVNKDLKIYEKYIKKIKSKKVLKK